MGSKQTRDIVNSENKKAALYWYYRQLTEQARRDDPERFNNTNTRYFIEQAAKPFFINYQRAWKIINEMTKNPPPKIDTFKLIEVNPGDIC